MSAWHEGLDDWLSTLHERLATDGALVRVVVAASKGSVPREPGACMIVSAQAQYGTIGGGHLEYTAVDIARSMLAARDAAGRVDRFVLGATLGQCCGGVVELAFDRYDESDRALLSVAIEARNVGRPIVLASKLEAPGKARRSLHAAEDCIGTQAAEDRIGTPASHRLVGTHIAQDLGITHRASDPVAKTVDALLAAPPGGVRAALVADGDGSEGILVERIDDLRPALWVFGAGHVSCALVRVLAGLPFSVTWVDDRDNAFPPALRESVTTVHSDDPVADVHDAPVGTHFLVLTHSHDLDLELCRAILARGDAASLGLIGSGSKSARFRRRLAQAGIPQAQIDALRCPIGVPAIHDKRPAVIAVAVAAELLQIVAAAAAAVTATGTLVAAATHGAAAWSGRSR